MYLLLVDHNLISSSDLKEMIEQAPPDTDIVNCYSQETLLKLADSISPDLVIIDFDLVKGDLADLLDSIRAKSKDTYLIALISPEYYDTLFNAIELGGIDDYMVKPIQKEDLMARVQIASRKKKQPFKGAEGALPFTETEKGPEAPGDFEEFRFPDQPGEPEQDSGPDSFDFGTGLEEDKEDQDVLKSHDAAGEDYLEPGEDRPEDRPFFEELTEQESFEEEDLSEEIEPGAGPAAGEEETQEDHAFDDLDLFGDRGEEEEQQESEEPGPVHGFDDIQAGSEEQEDQDQDRWFMEEDHSQDTQAPTPDLFDDIDKPDHETEQAEESRDEDDQEELLKLFEDVDNIFDDQTDSQETSKPDEEKKPFEDADRSDSEPGPDVVRPADEFLGTSRPKQKDKPSPLAGDKKFFDDLFDDEPESDQRNEAGDAEAGDGSPSGQQQDRESPEFFEPDFQDSGEEGFEEEDFEEDASPGRPPISREEIRRRSSLPGKSADDFLFGEDSSEDQDSGQPDYDHTNDNSSIFDDDEEDQEDQGRARRQKKPRGRFRGFLSIFGNVLFVALILVMAGLSFFLIQSRVTGGVPQVAGYQMYIVLSGSMSPEFDTGSLAFVRDVEPQELIVGDIITYRSPNDPDSLTTHRIVEVQREDGLSFITRGDANNVNDPNPVPEENVVGIVTGSVPYVGYLLNFVQTTQGLILLIFVPGVLIIAFELNKIIKYLTQGEAGNRRDRKNDFDSLAEGES